MFNGDTMGKITPMMHDDIIMWRARGHSWRTISAMIAEEYGVEISPSAVYQYYKKNLEEIAKSNINVKETYEKKTGKNTEEELVNDIEVLNLAILVGREILEGRKFKTAHQYQATVSGVATAIKVKCELICEKENKVENPLLKIFMEDD